MPRTFLAAFRGADGRSIGRALILLLFIAGSLSAFHAGRMAAGVAGDVVICAAGGDGAVGPGHPTSPLTQDHCLCCALGCGGTVLASLDTVAAPTTADHSAPQGPAFIPASAVRTTTRQLSTAPRGPPVLA